MHTILIVDDEKHIRMLYEEELADEGYHILTASNGVEALHVVHKEPAINLILLDLKMPEMDGPEFLRNLRQFNATLPVIISTAYGDYVEQDFNVWLSNDYSPKTSDLTELKARIREILRKSSRIEVQ